MKKLFVGICAMALVMAACQQSDGFKVEGIADGFNEGDTLYFYDEMGSEQPSDTIVVRDGKFALEGPVDSVKLCSVVAADGSAGAIFFKEKGDIAIVLSRNNPPKVSGTKANNAWQEVSDLQTEYSAKFESLTTPLYRDELDETQRQQIIASYQAVEREMVEKILDVADANLDNALGYFVLTSMADSEVLTPDRLKDMIGRMPAEYQQRKEITDILDVLKASENTTVGKTMPDFTLPTPDGQQLSALGEVAKNKVTILDFWAKWCGPCCDEMPSMVALYEKYKDKGLGILGISLDTDKDSWVEGITGMNMTWPQVSELKGWKSDIVELYQVNAIPYTVIVDQKGTILDKGLRAESLEIFVEEALK